MTPAFAGDARPIGADRHRTLSEMLDDPAVLVEYAPGACAYEYSDIFGGPTGASPDEALRRICRDLRRRPTDVLCDPDPKAATLGPARFYLTDDHGAALARVTGFSADLANSALLSLAVSGWAPGDVEHVTVGDRQVADLMPTRAPTGRLLPPQAALL